MPLITVKPGIYVIGGRELSHILDTNVYLVNVNNFYILIDTGTSLGLNNLLSNLMELNIDIEDLRYVILTHSHFHAAGGAYIFNNLPSLVVAHEPDSSYLRKLDLKKMSITEDLMSMLFPIHVSINIPLNKHVFKLHEGITIIHTPGHTEGSISVFVENAGAVFVGDLTSNVLSRDWGSNEEVYHYSIREIITLVEKYSVEILCSSYNCIRGTQSIVEFLEQLLSKKPLWV